MKRKYTVKNITVHIDTLNNVDDRFYWKICRDSSRMTFRCTNYVYSVNVIIVLEISSTENLPVQCWRMIDSERRFQSSAIFLYLMKQAVVATITYKNDPEEEFCPDYVSST